MAAPPLIARRYRAHACVAVAVALAVLIWLGVRYAGQSHAGAFDHAVDGWFMARLNARAALWAADLGQSAVVLVLGAAVVGACAAWRTVRGVALAVLAPLVSTSLTEYVIKPLVQRTKDGYYAYPSGHTAGFFAVAFVLVLVVLGAARRRLSAAARRTVTTVSLLLVAACGVGLVGSDYHYATDVVGGACLALVSVLGVALAVDVLAAARPSP